jgi:gamma-glutamyltranspeptidase/glutathione hydrolase
MLKILEGFDLKSMGQNSADALHLMIEAKKLAFADRDRYLADRDFMKVSVTDFFSPKRVEALRERIRMDRANDGIEAVPLSTTPSVSPPRRGTMKEGARDGDTEYVATADREGNLVSFIQSNFMGFGSGVVEPETAIILQNRGHLFSLDENHPNCIGPHKRCLHTLMPGMIFKNGKPYAALGLKGGHVQPQVQAQIISNLIDFDMTIQEAIASARFNHIEATKVGLEPEIAQAATEELTRRGHKIVSGNRESFGGAHAIVIHPESGAFIGGSDPRKAGCALGF